MSAAQADAHIPAAEGGSTAVAHWWGWSLIFGLITVAAGVIALSWPGLTIFSFAIIIAVQLLVYGVFRFVTALSGGPGTVAHLLLAVLAVLAGILCLRHPLATDLALPIVLGAFWTIGGVVELFNGITARGLPGRGWTIAAGVLSLVAGILLLTNPIVGLVVLTWLLGIWLIIYGVIAVVASIRQHWSPAGRAAPSMGRPSAAGPAPAG